MKQKRDCDNYILSDCDTPTDFVRGVERASRQPWNVIEKDGTMAKAKVFRIISFYLTPLAFLLRHPKARNVLAWQQFFGILAAFYNKYIFHRRRLAVTIMTFIYKPKRGLPGKLFYKMVNSAICSKYVKTIIVFAPNEIDYYEHLFPGAKGKFRFVSLGIVVDKNDYRDVELAAQDYYFSTGKSNRDYDFLVEVFSGLDSKLKIACPGVNSRQNSNIEILSDCYRSDTKRYLCNCKGVVIALKDLNISSGQLVFIQAMQFGKPIIITDSRSTRGYLEDNLNALIIPNDLNLWRQGIERLNTDKKLRAAMSEHNKKRGLSDFSISGFGENVGRLI